MSGLSRRTFLQRSACIAGALYAVKPGRAETPCEGVRRVDDGAVLQFAQGGQPVWTYRYADVPHKPYVQELYSPKGVQILRDAPKDHLHHHGLMYAIAADDVTYWEESERGGHQVHRAFEEAPAGGLTESLIWRNPAGNDVLRERRSLQLACDAPDVTLLTWTTTLEPVQREAPITLTGHHYYGLGMRFVESMDKGGRFLNAANAEGVIVRGDEKNFEAAWCAYQAEADGKPVTVAMFDGAANPRPATWFTMGDVRSHFAYLAATLNLYNDPMQLEAEGITVKYGVALWDGHVNREAIVAQYEEWRRASDAAGRRNDAS